MVQSIVQSRVRIVQVLHLPDINVPNSTLSFPHLRQAMPYIDSHFPSRLLTKLICNGNAVFGSPLCPVQALSEYYTKINDCIITHLQNGFAMPTNFRPIVNTVDKLCKVVKSEFVVAQISG